MTNLNESALAERWQEVVTACLAKGWSPDLAAKQGDALIVAFRERQQRGDFGEAPGGESDADRIERYRKQLVLSEQERVALIAERDAVTESLRHEQLRHVETRALLKEVLMALRHRHESSERCQNSCRAGDMTCATQRADSVLAKAKAAGYDVPE